MKVLIEAAGSQVSNFLIENIQQARHTVVASDISSFNHAFVMADEFLLFPESDDPNLWDQIEQKIIEAKIDVVIPSLDETMIGWAQRKEYFRKKDIFVVVSEEKTIEIFQSKWNTYNFFEKLNIPTPMTSYEKQEHPLVKPIYGRGAVGVCIPEGVIEMKGMISQELCEGTEYTIDALFDREGNPVYIVPRVRLGVKQGKSTRGEVKHLPEAEIFIKKISSHTKFYGPINFQCFEHKGKLKFTEVNPRIAGGMALGIAASENWFKLILDNISDEDKKIQKNVDIKYGLKMARYYAECFFS